jgi:putative PIN family toxin of toxin-antitoxin system
MKRVVLDTCVIVSALRSRRGASHVLLRAVALGKLLPIVSPPLFLEYEDVVKRPDQRLVHKLDIADIDRFLMALASACEPVDIHFRWRPQMTDPGDEMVLEAAVNGRADALVTHNVHHFRRAASRFGVSVVRPGDMVEEMKR